MLSAFRIPLYKLTEIPRRLRGISGGIGKLRTWGMRNRVMEEKDRCFAKGVSLVIRSFSI